MLDPLAPASDRRAGRSTLAYGTVRGQRWPLCRPDATAQSRVTALIVSPPVPTMVANLAAQGIVLA